MTPDELEEYLHKHIPISHAMGVSVERAGADRVVLLAPLEPNINHRKTVFGGSAASVAMLAGWSLMRLRLKEERLECRIVIQKNEMRFGKPIETAFSASASLKEPMDWQRFTDAFWKKGLARTEVAVTVSCEGGDVASFIGIFAAIRKADSD